MGYPELYIEVSKKDRNVAGQCQEKAGCDFPLPRKKRGDPQNGDPDQRVDIMHPHEGSTITRGNNDRQRVNPRQNEHDRQHSAGDFHFG